MAPAWPCFAYFETCLGPCVAFCGPAWRYFALFASCLGPCVDVAPCASCLLCFRLWLLGPCAPVWPYFAFLSNPLSPSHGLCSLCLGPCATFCGPAWHVWPCVALPCLPCLLSRTRHGLLWPSRGLPALPVLALAWPSAAPAWALLALLFSTLAPPLG